MTTSLRVWVTMGYADDQWVPCEVFVHEQDAKKWMADERACEQPRYEDLYHQPRRLRT